MSDRRRLLRVITRLNVGGPSTHVVIAERGLRARGWETLLVHGSIEADEAEIDVDALDIPRRKVPTMARSISARADARAFADIASIIRSYRPDVIHTHMSKAGLLTRSAAMVLSRAPRVHTFHGNIFSGYFGGRTSAAIIRAERLLASTSARIVALSDQQKAALIAAGVADARRIEVVPLGLDLAPFRNVDPIEARRRLGLDPDELAIVTIARLVGIKRLDRLLDATAALHARGIPARLHLVGDGPERPALEARAAELGLGSAAVVFHGWSDQAVDWHGAADVVALTSDSEGTPLVLIEAAAAARPVVATDVGGVADVVQDGSTGFVVDPGRPEALVDALAALLMDRDLARRFGSAGRERAHLWDAERLVDDLDDLYRRLLSR